MIRALAALAGLVVIGGALGRLAGPFDSLALLRVPAAVVLLLCVPALRGRARRLLAGGLAVAALASWGAGLVPGSGGADLLLYQKNVFFRNQTPDLLVGDILDSGAEVVTLQELSAQARQVKEALAASYPFVHACNFRGWEIAVLSRLPFSDAAPVCSRARGMAAVQVDTRAGPAWVASVHQPWPWPHGGWDRSLELAGILDGLDGPVVVAGDFNTVPWSAAVRRVARAARGRVVGPAVGSLRVDAQRAYQRRDMTGAFDANLGWWAVPLPIDHVIAPGGGHRSLRPLLGSDHHGLLAEVRLSR